MELGGLTAGSGYDQIEVVGAANLAGKVSIRTLNGFVPLPGSVFDVIKYTSRVGDVSIINETPYAGLVFTKGYSASALRLTAIARAGDADLNAEVNLNDFTILASNFGLASNWLGGEFNGNGLVDLNDFTLLATNFGTSSATIVGRSSVPEPSAGFTITAGLLILCRRRANGKSIAPAMDTTRLPSAPLSAMVLE